MAAPPGVLPVEATISLAPWGVTTPLKGPPDLEGPTIHSSFHLLLRVLPAVRAWLGGQRAGAPRAGAVALRHHVRVREQVLLRVPSIHQEPGVL